MLAASLFTKVSDQHWAHRSREVCDASFQGRVDAWREIGKSNASAAERELSAALRTAAPAIAPEIRASGYRALAEVLAAQGRFPGAEDALREALRIGDPRSDSKDPSLARTLLPLASVLTSQGRHAEAQTLAARALSVAETGSADMALALRQIAASESTQGAPTASVTAQRALDTFHHAFGPGSRELIEAEPDLRRLIEDAARSAPYVSLAHLPVTSRDLFGRASELAWLDDCWAKGVHVASIVSWGGVGKSALVNAWLATMRDAGWRGAERVFGWSFYSQRTDRLSSSDEFVDSALRWFGDPDPSVGSPWDKGERLAALVRKERTLLVLDGMEPLQWGPGVEAGKLKDPALQALVKDLGAQNKGLCLITTRIAVADLEALAGDRVQNHGLDHLSVEAGAELLRARGAHGSEEELRAAAKEYDGHSLALTLLGTYLRKAHKGDIRKRDLIPPLAGKPAERMMQTYERWFRSKPELALLRMLGLFDRPAPEDEIAALRAPPVIAGLTDALEGLPRWTWNEAVTSLRDVGLLLWEPEPEEAARLDAHPLVREHFGEQLRRERPEAWREGHRRLYEHLKGKGKELPDTIEEMAPLYAAVVHGCLAGKTQEAFREVWWKRIQRGRRRYDTVMLGAFGSEAAVLSAFFDPPWERLAPGLTETDGTIVFFEAGFALRALGRLPEAAGLLRLALEREVAGESWQDAAATAANLSGLLQARGELGEALTEARRSVELADRSGNPFHRMACRTMLAAVLHATGDREDAAAWFEEAERMQEARHRAAYPGFQYCDLLLDKGRDAEVRERAAQALEWTRQANASLLDIALDHLSLGRAHLLAVHRGGGDLALAASHLAAAVDGLRRAGYQDMLPLGLLARASLHTYTRAFALARKDLDEVLTLATRSGFRLHEADAHLGLARLSLAEGDCAAARRYLDRARRIIDTTAYHRRDGELAELDALCRAGSSSP
jgi:tetratricopeptide (TPR) repeat protein